VKKFVPGGRQRPSASVHIIRLLLRHATSNAITNPIVLCFFEASIRSNSLPSVALQRNCSA
jgi:hypothetical protein